MKYRDIFFHDTRQHCTIEKLFKTRIYTVVPVASQYIISPDSHPSQLQNSGFKYSQAPDIQSRLDECAEQDKHQQQNHLMFHVKNEATL